jgi:hypothetical protein
VDITLFRDSKLVKGRTVDDTLERDAKVLREVEAV